MPHSASQVTFLAGSGRFKSSSKSLCQHVPGTGEVQGSDGRGVLLPDRRATEAWNHSYYKGNHAKMVNEELFITIGEQFGNDC